MDSMKRNTNITEIEVMQFLKLLKCQTTISKLFTKILGTIRLRNLKATNKCINLSFS